MNAVTALCASVAASCLTLAAVHLVMWARNRTAPANLAFVVLAVGVAAFTGSELAMMLAPTPDAFVRALVWTNVIVFILVLAVVAFVRLYFRTGRAWLGHAAWVVRLAFVVTSLALGTSFDYAHVERMRAISVLGERVYVAEGTATLWHWLGQLSLLLVLVFVVDACYGLWRTGDALKQRRALVIGIPTAAFVLVGASSAALIFSNVIRDVPHLEFIPFLGVLAAMGYELSSDVLRAAQLTRELQVSEAALRESERRMTMAADAARLGLWIWDLRTGELWLTTKCRDLFNLPPAVPVTYEMFVGALHPDDRKRVEQEIRLARESGVADRTEYRLAFPDGHTRWIAAHVRVDTDETGRPYRMLGVCIDVSEQRSAELKAHELGGRLITAQEEERRRIARDLHDDLNQRLSVLSVELDMLGREQPSRVRGRIEEVAAGIRALSSEVHGMSYRLHPAKLDQLGLEVAARSWCREITQQSGVAVEFRAAGVPAELPPDVALCLYRVLQEALRNVVRHSESATARVELASTADGVRLVVSDAGCGFDVDSTRQSPGLGLVSMAERAHLLRGSIRIESRPGDGSRLTLTIPLPDRGASPSAEVSEVTATAGGAGTP